MEEDERPWGFDDCVNLMIIRIIAANAFAGNWKSFISHHLDLLLLLALTLLLLLLRVSCLWNLNVRDN
jgi:hypothetical protein